MVLKINNNMEQINFNDSVLTNPKDFESKDNAKKRKQILIDNSDFNKKLNNMLAVVENYQRPTEQIINEGKAMLAAKDNEIKFMETSFKSVYNEQERQIKSLSQSLEYAIKRSDELWEKQAHFDKTLRRQYVEKNDLKRINEKLNIELTQIKDQNNEYLNKITSDHKELTRLRGDIKYIDKCNVEMRNHIDDIELENRHLKVLSKVFLVFYIISVIASLLIIRFI